MRKARSTLLYLILLLGAVLGAAAEEGRLGLLQMQAACDGPGTFGYTATWTDTTGAGLYQLTTGNQCAYEGQVCADSGGTCLVGCNGRGQCGAQLSGCVVGPGAWLQVTTINGTVHQRKAVSPPGRCN